jgi:hypothetical protein
MSRSDAVTACSGTGELSDRENEAVLRTSVGFCEDEAESEDDMKGEEGRQEMDQTAERMSKISVERHVIPGGFLSFEALLTRTKPFSSQVEN